jgi:hypothetical protein
MRFSTDGAIALPRFETGRRKGGDCELDVIY